MTVPLEDVAPQADNDLLSLWQERDDLAHKLFDELASRGHNYVRVISTGCYVRALCVTTLGEVSTCGLLPMDYHDYHRVVDLHYIPPEDLEPVDISCPVFREALAVAGLASA